MTTTATDLKANVDRLRGHCELMGTWLLTRNVDNTDQPPESEFRVRTAPGFVPDPVCDLMVGADETVHGVVRLVDRVHGEMWAVVRSRTGEESPMLDLPTIHHHPLYWRGQVVRLMQSVMYGADGLYEWCLNEYQDTEDLFDGGGGSWLWGAADAVRVAERRMWMIRKREVEPIVHGPDVGGYEECKRDGCTGRMDYATLKVCHKHYMRVRRSTLSTMPTPDAA